MLKLLSITNFAVVTEATVELDEGLNLLTGETGSGKSIFVDALGLLLGARASSEIVRAGESAAFIQGIFDVQGNVALERLAAEAGIDLGDGELIVRREITAGARSRTYVNDQLVTLSLLRSLRPSLVDIHGQGDQQSLLYPDAHVELLDEFGSLQPLVDEVGRLHTSYAALRRDLATLRRTEAERLRSADILGFQLAEIERIAPVAGEDDELEQTRAILANAERLVQLSGEAYGMLHEESEAVLPILGQVERRVEQLARYDGRFDAYIDQIRTVKYTLEDLAYFLRDYLQDVDFSAERLKIVDDRLLELDRLKRKYGSTLAEVIAALDDMRGQLETLSSSEERASALTLALSESKEAYLKAAYELSTARREAASRLEDRVMAELGELAMGETRFVVRIDSVGEEDGGHGASGLDRVEFFVATNPGEEPRPLVKIASGGEISRLMLALKTVSSPPEIPRTLVFDEVDVGIGGRVSEAIGQRLWRLSRANQVLCVTHQAQIARFADAHFTVRKERVGGRAATHVAKLDRRGQVEELARMIGGADVTETARRHARELLKTK
jgi:DNA repair protein RecN (Recombination protein N)